MGSHQAVMQSCPRSLCEISHLHRHDNIDMGHVLSVYFPWEGHFELCHVQWLLFILTRTNQIKYQHHQQ